MVGGNLKDIFFYDYEKYGYTDSDFEDDDSEENVVAECEYKEVCETLLLEKNND